MLLAQIGVLMSTLALAWSDPVQTPWFTAAAAFAIAFFSATQDIAVDAYRIEILNDDEQGPARPPPSSAIASRCGSSTPWRCCCRPSCRGRWC